MRITRARKKEILRENGWVTIEVGRGKKIEIWWHNLKGGILCDSWFDAWSRFVGDNKMAEMMVLIEEAGK